MIVYRGPLDDAGALIQFFRRESPRLRALRKVIITPEKTLVCDVNRDAIEFPGLTYGSPVLEALLRELRVVFVPSKLHDASVVPGGVKEFLLSARHAWGQDRVM